MKSENDESSNVAPLDETQVPRDPIELFRAWLSHAEAAGAEQATAMTLATATREGRPSARLLLLKGADSHGFVFFTNYRSRKAQELEQNPYAAMVFYWLATDRQVRIEGRVERILAAESDAYFETRPLGSRLSAAASPQSQVVKDRAALERLVDELKSKYGGAPVPRPASWGGYRLVPETIEFWQNRPDRLHDRLRYRRQESGEWVITRLAP
jgi:pyridoxamine 5'-phosphate oxidase